MKRALGAALAVAVLGGAGYGGYRLLNPYHFFVEFDEADRLQPGDRVYVKGVSVADVASVELPAGGEKTRVRIVPYREHRRTLTRGALFFITNERLITGKKCIEAVVAEPGQPPLENGAVVQGQSSFQAFMRELLRKTADLGPLKDQLFDLARRSGAKATEWMKEIDLEGLVGSGRELLGEVLESLGHGAEEGIGALDKDDVGESRP